MAGIKDVASRAGVSIATVSRVLNQKGSLSEKTKEKVYQAVRELQYEPNALARSFGKQKTGIIGLLSLPMQHPFYGELVTHIEEETYRRGYKLMVITSLRDCMKEENCTNMIRSNLLDGILLGAHPVQREAFDELPVPAVSIETLVSPQISSVVSDNYQGGVMATRHLLAKGCRRLVHITGDLSLDLYADQRGLAFQEVCRECQVEHYIYESTEAMLRNMDYSEVIGRILYEHPDVDGIFASSDVIGAEAVKMASALGYQIGEQLRIIGFDNTQLGKLLNPPLTTIAQDMKTLAAVAVELLIEQIEQGNTEKHRVLPVTLIERKTT